jgi:hypothetical protein
MVQTITVLNHDASDYMMTMMMSRFNHGHHGNQTNHGSDKHVIVLNHDASD